MRAGRHTDWSLINIKTNSLSDPHTLTLFAITATTKQHRSHRASQLIPHRNSYDQFHQQPSQQFYIVAQITNLRP
jgi:hypothetical protein